MEKQNNNFAKYSSIALQMAIIITIGVFGGRYLDVLFKIKFPIFTLLFSLISIALAIYTSIIDFLKQK